MITFRCLLVWVLCLMTSLLASSCASLRETLLLQADDVGAYSRASEEIGLPVSEDNYTAALRRWPWAEGAQLHRRALIMSLNLGEDTLEELDQSRSAEVELEILNRSGSLRLSRAGR